MNCLAGGAQGTIIRCDGVFRLVGHHPARERYTRIVHNVINSSVANVFESAVLDAGVGSGGTFVRISVM